MPELPEVETTRRGLSPHVIHRRIERIEVSQPQLRWPVPDRIQQLQRATINSLERRAKYLLMGTDQGYLIWHLGMSGSMRIMPAAAAGAKHEHIRVLLDDGNSIRYRDPRRFGALLYSESEPLTHPLLTELGPEPLSSGFNVDYLQRQCQKRSTAIKNLIMDSHVVVGVGNIYACESLFASGINPKTRASRISRQRLQRLVDAIKMVLQQAIDHGGTTLQDFTQADGKPGYFRHSLNVYGQPGPCPVCGNDIKRITLGQRSTFYCSHCQR
ncbi:MAG: bifunctional DNA-formamidopyrimidine glycosylase/DNA-(apurinic or apyrimidinic site) lyase [Gammaproteobacteria bacterium]|nr:bifunctional DNA-formamidopyrimidine glycosylase/DNA-(apurinic or apyrimidinic site) lyase [Gammaproteobacteria bacterium]